MNAGQVSKALINRVDLTGRYHRLDDRHDSLADVAVKRIVATESDLSMPPKVILDLEVRLAHFHEWLGVVRPSDHASIVVRQDD